MDIDDKIRERKSRRTHKNSRDGCPNCKAKRIKCTEELPQCTNCIKKRYRCGYLDFPQDKLDHIRLKHAKKQKEEVFLGNKSSSAIQMTENSSSVSSSVVSNKLSLLSAGLNGQVEFLAFEPEWFHSPYENGKLYEYNPHVPQLHNQNFSIQYYPNQTRSLSESINQYSPYLPIQPINQPMNQQINQQVSQPINQHHLHQNQINQQPVNQLLYPQYDHGMTGDSSQVSLTPHHTPYHTPMTVQPQTPYVQPEVQNYQVEYEVPLPNQFNYEPTVSNLNENGPVQKRVKSCLPNSINQVSKFNRLKHRLPRSHRDDGEEYYYLSVWNKELSQKFWTKFFEIGFKNPVFNAFLLDKSLGLLLTDVHVVLTSDYLKNYHNTYKPVTSINTKNSNNGSNNKTEKETKEYQDFFFDERVLDRFISLSYVYYAKLIKSIKDGLDRAHIEETIRISFMSSYSSYFLLNSSVETSIKLNNGTSSLLRKFVGECTKYNQLTQMTKYITDILHNHVNFCLVPDLDFAVIDTILEQFQNFKDFLTNSTNIYQSMKASELIRDFLPKHDCIEFENFLQYLEEDFRPELEEIKKKFGCKDRSIRYVSVKLLFELVSKYFKMLPSTANSLGSNVFIMQRIFYLFFVAMGKALTHLFTPIRSILNIDCNNVMYPLIEFNFLSFKIDKERDNLNDFQFEFLNKISNNLLRLISFYNIRTLLYGHFLSNRSVLNDEYVKLVESPDSKEKYVQILPEKLAFEEAPIDFHKDFNFNITLKNLPNFPEFAHYPKDCFENPDGICDLSVHEVFNYDIGLSNRDFNPTKLIEEFLNQQKTKWEFNTVRLSTIQTRSKNFDLSRKVIQQSLDIK